MKYQKQLTQTCYQAALVFMLLLTQGCSLLVANSGLKLEKVFHSTATVESVQKQLGKAIHSEDDRAELEFPEEGYPAGFQSLQGPSGSVDKPEFREDYRYKGYVVPADDGSRAAAVLLLFEPILFPGAVIHRIKGSRDVHWFSAWYDASGRYITAKRRTEPAYEGGLTPDK